MGQSLAQIYVHAIFGTKNRENFITPKIETDLHSYISGILKNLESPVIEINSMPDHIHILFRLSKNMALSKVFEEVKKTSSLWVKPKGIPDFTWQIGYGAFSVSSSKLAVVRTYIRNQKEHHKTVSFQEEIEVFIKEYNLNTYDAEFFWR